MSDFQPEGILRKDGQGQVYFVDGSLANQRGFIKNIPGISEGDRETLRVMMSLAEGDQDQLTTEVEVAKVLSTKTPTSAITVRKRILELTKLGFFEREEVPRPGKKPASIYRLNSLVGLETSAELEEREEQRKAAQAAKEVVKLNKDVESVFSDPVLAGSDNFQRAIQRKINNVILSRCSPEKLGEAVEIYLPGYKESFAVTQRVMSGYHAMDGSEDRLQQALLTCFKESIAALKRRKPNLEVGDLKNSWIVDMREVCKTMHIKPSSANIEWQARKLFALRYNSFTIDFEPDSVAAREFNLVDRQKTYAQDDSGELVQLRQITADRQFLVALEPLDENMEIPGLGEVAITDNDRNNYRTKNPRGKIYRFYKVSFHPSVFEEVVNEALNQLHSQPASLLYEDNVYARQLFYMAARILARPDRPIFEETWGTIAKELFPLRDTYNVFEGFSRLFHERYGEAARARGVEASWAATQEAEGEERTIRRPIELHGFLFETIMPPGMAKQRKHWVMSIRRAAGAKAMLANAHRDELKRLRDSL